MARGEDLLSKLPDSLLALILSKICIKEAVRCSILSRRWRFLYTQIPYLTLSPCTILGDDYGFEHAEDRGERVISNLLLSRTSALDSLYLSNNLGEVGYEKEKVWDFSYESLCTWIRYAARTNVKHLWLSISDGLGIQTATPLALFSCTYLQQLGLCYLDLTHIPHDFLGFNHLTSFILKEVFLTYESLAKIISHCPLLQKLKIDQCFGFGLQDFVIAGCNIERLTVSEMNLMNTLVIVNCLKLNTLRVVKGFGDLRVNGVLFSNLGDLGDFKLWFDGGRVTKMNVDLSCVSGERYLVAVSNFQSLKHLTVHSFGLTHNVSHLCTLLDKLPNLQFLYSSSFLEVLIAVDIPRCLNTPHLNLKRIRLALKNLELKTIAMLGCLLQSTPALETMEIELPCNNKYRRIHNKDTYTRLLENILYPSRASMKARLCIICEGM